MMPRVLVTRPTGEKIEISDLTVSEVKELLGLNGQVPAAVVSQQVNIGESLRTEPHYGAFFHSLTEKGKQFINVLKSSPSGISADNLAEKLGFESGANLGGVTGGGLAKNAQKYGVALDDAYTRAVKFENGMRVVKYFPGAKIHLMA